MFHVLRGHYLGGTLIVKGRGVLVVLFRDSKSGFGTSYSVSLFSRVFSRQKYHLTFNFSLKWCLLVITNFKPRPRGLFSIFSTSTPVLFIVTHFRHIALTCRITSATQGFTQLQESMDRLVTWLDDAEVRATCGGDLANSERLELLQVWLASELVFRIARLIRHFPLCNQVLNCQIQALF